MIGVCLSDSYFTDNEYWVDLKPVHLQCQIITISFRLIFICSAKLPLVSIGIFYYSIVQHLNVNHDRHLSAPVPVS